MLFILPFKVLNIGCTFLKVCSHTEFENFFNIYGRKLKEYKGRITSDVTVFCILTNFYGCPLVAFEGI
jgi:hypothetical protein